MKKIYIVLTHTGTCLSRIIKCFTHDEYSHSSIALDKYLDKMYSFGRLNPNNPFIGGFVRENIRHGTFKKFYKTQASVFSMMITDEQYEIIEKTIQNIKERRDDYKFNIIGLFAVGIHKKITFDESFYCAEFVKYVLDKAELKLDLPEMIKPEDFKNIIDLKLEYKGKLKDYNNEKRNYLKEVISNRNNKECNI